MNKLIVYKIGGIFKAYLKSKLLASGGSYDNVVANAKIEASYIGVLKFDEVHLAA